MSSRMRLHGVTPCAAVQNRGFRQEHGTAAFVAEKLRASGYDVREGIGRTGIFGSLTKGHGPCAIVIRTDIDALPIQETGGVVSSSDIPGKTHACGRDGTDTLLAASQLVAALQSNPSPHGTSARCNRRRSRSRTASTARRRWIISTSIHPS